MPHARILQLFAAATLLLGLSYFLLLSPARYSARSANPWTDARLFAGVRNSVTHDADILGQLKDVPTPFEYQRYCVFAREKPGLRRSSVVPFPQDFFHDFVPTIITPGDDGQSSSLFPPCHAAFTIDVPEFSSRANADTSALMLGVATTLKRVEESLPTFARWLAYTGSPLVVLLVDQDSLDQNSKDLARVITDASALGIQLLFEPYHSIYEHDSEGLKNFGLAAALQKHRTEATSWFGIIDDDTFFLSLPNVLDSLAEYDPEKKWYIGALTEGHARLAHEGFKAWGGAGFFISPPLMRLLAENMARCVPLDKFFGDILWRDCIMELTSPTVHLTELPGLNQMDLWNDMAGWYEAGFNPILTLHHWKSWHYFPIADAHTVADVAGPDALLQRYQFANHTVFTNGYSIVRYPLGVPDLNLVELTMTEDVDITRPPPPLEFHHSMGRTRPALRAGDEKISWVLEHSITTPDATVRQFYLHRTARRPDGPVDSIIELDWRHV